MDELRADIAKLEAEMMSLGVHMKVDEAMALLAKRSPEATAQAGAILRSSPEVYDAYQPRRPASGCGAVLRPAALGRADARLP